MIHGAMWRERPRARLDWPWHVSAALAVVLLLFGGFLVYRIDGALRAWSESSPLAAWLASFAPVALVGAALVVGVYWLAGRAYYSIARSRADAFQTLLTRTRLGVPVRADMIGGWQQAALAEQQAIALELGRAPYTRYPLLSTLSEGNHEEATTTINGVGEEETAPPSPPIVTLDSFPPLDSPTAVPLGLSGAEPIGLDFGKDTLHVGLYGASGAGKDNLLRAWFMTLTRRNTPDAVSFAVLDGKGDWLTADLAQLAHMWMPPAGGVGQHGAGLMKIGIERIEAELSRRMQLINGAGCRTREMYMQRTGATLPLLIVYVTDGVTAVEGALTGLMNDLVSKARAAGIRVVVSMQTPTGQDMRWRLNLSTYISGHLPHPSQDLVALGLTKGELADLRPSQLPTPEQERGLFIVRQGAMVKKVKAVFVSDEAFDGYVSRLARRSIAADPHADLKASLRAMDDLARLRELRRLALIKGNTRTGYRYSTDELRELFGMQQNKLVAIVGAIRSAQNGHAVDVALR